MADEKDEKKPELDAEENLVVESPSPEEIGAKLFRWRDYTPIPLIILMIWLAEPTALSATIGLMAIVAGELLRIYSVSFIGSISRTRKNRTGGNLISDGPFGLVRNPLYVGNFLISSGLACYSGSVVVLLLTIVAFCGQYYFIVRYEEKLLRDQFGEEYETYCATVARWFPKKTPKIDDFPPPADWRPALKSEKRTLSAIGVLLIVLIATAINIK